MSRMLPLRFYLEYAFSTNDYDRMASRMIETFQLKLDATKDLAQFDSAKKWNNLILAGCPKSGRTTIIKKMIDDMSEKDYVILIIDDDVMNNAECKQLLFEWIVGKKLAVIINWYDGDISGLLKELNKHIHIIVHTSHQIKGFDNIEFFIAFTKKEANLYEKAENIYTILRKQTKFRSFEEFLRQVRYYDLHNIQIKDTGDYIVERGYSKG